MPLPAGLKFWDPTVILGPAACRAKPWWWPKLLPRSVQRWCTSMWTWRSATQKWPTHFCSRTRDLFGIWTCFNYLHKNVDPQSLGFGRNPLSVPSPDMDCKLPFLFDLEVWTSNLSWWNPKRGRPNFLFSSRIPSNHWFWCCFRFSKKWPNKTPSDITWDTAPIAALPNIAPHWVLNRSAANPLFGRTGLWIIWTNPPNVKHAEPRLDHGVLPPTSELSPTYYQTYTELVCLYQPSLPQSGLFLMKSGLHELNLGVKHFPTRTAGFYTSIRQCHCRLKQSYYPLVMYIYTTNT